MAEKRRYSRKPGRRHRADSVHPEISWTEKEYVDGKVLNAGVIILKTRGCSHFWDGGCSMCGYNVGTSGPTSEEDIIKQFSRAVDALGDFDFLKVYTSGSFPDKGEVPSGAADHILRECSDRDVKLLVESRPEYVTPEWLGRMISGHDKLELALGLESANDKVLKYSINKGFTVADYDAAASLIKESGVGLRTYVLLKPPFLTENEAIEDAVATAKHAARFSDSISVNAVNVQKGTLVEKLWKDWAYRPPWLWSALEVAERCADLGPKLLCDPVGGGTQRGAHNCGECDRVVLDGLKAFTISQDMSRLARPECRCHELYSAIMELEGRVMGGTADLQRLFRRA